jgi:hypothetical protein
MVRGGRVLGALLLSANQPVPVSMIIDMLWPVKSTANSACAWPRRKSAQVLADRCGAGSIDALGL